MAGDGVIRVARDGYCKQGDRLAARFKPVEVFWPALRQKQPSASL
jgi:hypothetical protein